MFYEEDYEWEEEQEIGECPVIYNWEEDEDICPVTNRPFVVLTEWEILNTTEVGITRLEAYLFSFCD